MKPITPERESLNRTMRRADKARKADGDTCVTCSASRHAQMMAEYIGKRMLAPRELYRAQGFPETYQIERGGDGRPLTKTAQVRMCGNSVAPPMAYAYVRANYAERTTAREAA